MIIGTRSGLYCWALLLLASGAAAEPYRYDDVRLGASFTRLAHDLDFRDIHAAIATQHEKQVAKPDLGRRGYDALERGAGASVSGDATAQARVKPALLPARFSPLPGRTYRQSGRHCSAVRGLARRDDPYADVACVSHDERVGGAETREIRLHFLDGVLQQFSITAEIRHFDAVMQVLRERHGTPQQTEPAPAGGYPSSAWRNAESRIIAYGGKDLVFVSFELAGYAEAVKRKQGGAQPQECR
jgi:hypothetical protein